LNTVFIDSLEGVEKQDWNRLVPADTPFLRHEFLDAMEQSGSVCADTGWLPRHCLLRTDDGDLVAAAPGYIKLHSYGEYVFDWAWADAYARHGLNYYPKLLSAIPFTPCVGPRLLMDRLHRNNADKKRSVVMHYFDACQTLCREEGLSSWHLLFPDESLHELEGNGARMLRRTGVQFHWYNRDYSDFDSFLAELNARKRKSIRRERQKIRDAGIVFRHVRGDALSVQELNAFYGFYAATYLRRGQHPYLNQRCFQAWMDSMAEQFLFVLAYRETELIAGALFLLGEKSVYGRYWGCAESISGLHFETCYYQGIDYCIAHGFQHFDAGAQGEHKLVRGFEPLETRSLHWLAHPEFSDAVAAYLEEERDHVDRYRLSTQAALPFRKKEPGRKI